MPLIGAILAVLLFTASPASTWNEPDNFRGVPWEASEAELKEKIPGVRCINFSNPLADRGCSTSFSVGPVPTKGFFGFQEGQLRWVRLTFDPKHFQTMQGIFSERYGAPSHQEEIPVKNRMGAEFLNVEALWSGNLITIRMRKYSGKITESEALYMTPTVFEEFTRRKIEQQKKGAGDL